MNLVPDPLITALQMLPFFGSLLVLKFLILDPVLAHLSERERRMSSLAAGGGDLIEEARRTQKQYDERQAALREQAVTIRAELIKAAQAEEQRIIAAAQQATAAETETYRGRINQEMSTARTELQGQASSLGERVAAAVLGREVSAAGPAN